MDELREASSGVRAPLRKVLPPPALCGFLLLLALMGAAAYAAGAASGPVAPGMQDTGTHRGGGAGGGTADMGGMHGGDR
ncbi:MULTISPECIES: hypothetical protein [Streptomyces]|uniref:hypothetical protein n=1 Tax=Streptomyces TaxID=1883 RepID=UPI001671017D|nr:MULTISPECIES: hypothetical protein [Streptomyces]UFR06261.1 hypothetical protein KBP30_36085 [Streptomyces sp. Go40/10]GGS61833.1 hypothetical protein GCM10010206_25000 [Streptomyces cinerochromogenes]